MSGTPAQRRRETLLRKAAAICPTMLRDIGSRHPEPTVRSTATHDGARIDDHAGDSDDRHKCIRDVLALTLDDVTDYFARTPGLTSAERYEIRKAILWIRQDSGDNPPPWSFDWCCREIGADPGAAYAAILELSQLRAAQHRRQRR